MGLEQMVTRPHRAMVETFCSCLAAHSGSEPEWKKECGCTQHRLIGLGVIGVPPILCPKRLQGGDMAVPSAFDGHFQPAWVAQGPESLEGSLGIDCFLFLRGRTLEPK